MTANFLFVSDDNYVKNLGIASYSVLHNMCPVADRVRIFVMDCGITEEHKAQLLRQAARFDNAALYFYNIEQQLDAVVPQVENHWHKAIYGRLFFPELLAQYDGLDRLIYLDCDLLMDQPVTELFEMDMQGKCVAGVADGYDYARKQALGIDLDGTYINSGVLLIDTARWAALNASERMIDFINRFPDELVYPDQDAINYVLAHDMLMLPPAYNMLWMLLDKDVPKMLESLPRFRYTAEELLEALHHGKIYHYAGRDMWCIDGITPVHTAVFAKYHALCDWRSCKRHYSSLSKMMIWRLICVKRALTGEH